MTGKAPAVPAVSIILPTHNRAALLGRSVGSVLAQTFRDFELIVVDDASTQDIAGAIAALGDSRARVIRLDQRSGGAGARNAGLAAARAPLIAFQDSDDEWTPDKLERQVAHLRAAGPQVAVSFHGFWREKEGGRTEYPKAGEPLLEGDLLAILLERNFITTAAALVRREALTEVGGFDASMPRYQDWDLWIRIARRHRFAYLPAPLLIQYHQDDSISANQPARLAARHRLLDKYRKDMLRYPGVRARQLREVARLESNAGHCIRALWLSAAAKARLLADRRA